MTIDQVLAVIAIILFIIAAVGTYVGKPALIAMGWVGLALVTLTLVV
jgi:hypothetical protein